MLRFTNATYMPRHELNEFQNRYSEQITASARTALQILGKRTNSIFYFNAEVEKGNSHFSKILTTTQDLGIELAKTISSLVSDIAYHDTLRQIMLHDISSICAIPDISFSVQEDGTFVIKESKLPYILLQDDKFLVAVLNRERYVEVFLYQKNNMIAVA